MSQKKNSQHARTPSAKTSRGIDLSPEATKAAIAIGVALGVGALAAGAVMMREPLGSFARSAAREATGLTKHVSVADLLSVAGLQKKPSIVWTIGTALGAMLVGTAAGSAAMWLVRQKPGPSTAESPAIAHSNSTQESPRTALAAAAR